MSASHCRAANSRATVKERMCVAWWKRASSEQSAKVEWGFWLKCNETWHNVLPKKLIFFFFYLSLTSSKRGQVCESVCVFVLKEQGPFNHRKAKCSTSLHGIHHHSPVLPDPSIFNPSFLTPPLPLLAIQTPQIHTQPPNDFLPVRHATEAKLLFLRIYNPKGLRQKGGWKSSL